MGGNLKWLNVMFDYYSATKMLPEVTEPLEQFGTSRILF